MKIKDRLKQFLSNKKITSKISLLVVVLGLCTFIVGSSYAILRGETSANNEQVIKAGNVEVLLTEYFDNIDKRIRTMSDENGLLSEDVYNFNIKNVGNIAGKYKIALNNSAPSEYTGEVLSSEYIKIGLEVNDEEYGPFTLEEANNILDSGIIYKKEIIDYNLRIWLDEDYSEELANMEDYKAFLKLDVTIEQKSDSSDSLVQKSFSYTGSSQTYKVPRDGTYLIELWGAEGGTL